MLLHEQLRNYRLLLASQSPRRRELMTGCGLPYELAPRFDCAEVYPAGLAAEEFPSTSRASRARPIPRRSPDGTFS